MDISWVVYVSEVFAHCVHTCPLDGDVKEIEQIKHHAFKSSQV